MYPRDFERQIARVLNPGQTPVEIPATVPLFEPAAPAEISVAFAGDGTKRLRYLFVPGASAPENWADAHRFIDNWGYAGLPIDDSALTTMEDHFNADSPDHRTLGVFLSTETSLTDGIPTLKAYCDTYYAGADASLPLAARAMTTLGYANHWNTIESMCRRTGARIPFVALDLSTTARVKIYTDTSHLAQSQILDELRYSGLAADELAAKVLSRAPAAAPDIPLGSLVGKPRSMLCWNFSTAPNGDPRSGLTTYLPLDLLGLDAEAMGATIDAVAGAEEPNRTAAHRLHRHLAEASGRSCPFHWLALKDHRTAAEFTLYSPKEVLGATRRHETGQELTQRGRI